jgi:hypothetical protein
MARFNQGSDDFKSWSLPVLWRCYASVAVLSTVESVPGPPRPRDALVVPRIVHMCCSALRASG